MSTDLDLDDLEGARDEVGDAIIAIARTFPEHPSTREHLGAALIGLGSAYSTIERAIEGVGEPVQRASDGVSAQTGASDG